MRDRDALVTRPRAICLIFGLQHAAQRCSSVSHSCSLACNAQGLAFSQSAGEKTNKKSAHTYRSRKARVLGVSANEVKKRVHRLVLGCFLAGMHWLRVISSATLWIQLRDQASQFNRRRVASKGCARTNVTQYLIWWSEQCAPVRGIAIYNIQLRLKANCGVPQAIRAEGVPMSRNERGQICDHASPKKKKP